MVKSLDGAVRGGPARVRLGQGQADAHARPGRARGRVGARAAHRLAVQPAPRCARPGDRRVRDAGQDVQGADRRDAARGRRSGSRSWRSSATSGSCTCGPRWWWRSRSTGCRARPRYPGGHGAAVRAGAALSRGQDAGRGGHRASGPRDPPGPATRRKMTDEPRTPMSCRAGSPTSRWTATTRPAGSSSLYSAASEGAAVVPWDRGTAHPLLIEWVDEARAAWGRADARSSSAPVLAGTRSWSPTAAMTRPPSTSPPAPSRPPTGTTPTRRRTTWPPTSLHHLPSGTAPSTWSSRSTRSRRCRSRSSRAAITQVTELVAPGGTLLVIAAARADDEPDDAVEGPPWPLTRAAIDSFTAPDLHLIELIQSPSPVDPTINRWRAEYLRD